MSVLLEGEHIHQELEVVDRRLTNHIHMVIDIIARELIEELRHPVESCLLAITISIITTGRAPTNRQIKIHTFGETRHELIAGTYLRPLGDRRGHIEADTRGASRKRQIQMLEDIVLLPILGDWDIVGLHLGVVFIQNAKRSN